MALAPLNSYFWEDGTPMGHWEETPLEKCDLKLINHNAQVFSSLTDPDGIYGEPTIYTEWGHRGADLPTCAEKYLVEEDVKKHYTYVVDNFPAR